MIALQLSWRVGFDRHAGRYLEASPPIGLMLAQAPFPFVICITLSTIPPSVVTITSSALQSTRNQNTIVALSCKSDWHFTSKCVVIANSH